jgi:cytoskeletal protein RodZ
VGITKRRDDLPPLVAIGRCIESARKRRRMTVARLSEKTKVSSRYISHIEAGEFELLPGRIYVIGFSRLICIALGLDHEKVIEAIKSDLYSQVKENFEPSDQKSNKPKLLARLLRVKKNSSQ